MCCFVSMYEFAKLNVQAGTKEVIIVSHKYYDREETMATRLMLNLVEVRFRKLTPIYSKVVIDFDAINS